MQLLELHNIVFALPLLVAVVLSAQSTDVGVNKATKGLFADAPTPAAMVALGEPAGHTRPVKRN